MSDFEDDFMADDEDYDLEYSEDSNSGEEKKLVLKRNGTEGICCIWIDWLIDLIDVHDQWS